MIEERVPPQNIEAEQAVLGAMLIDKEAIAKATEVLLRKSSSVTINWRTSAALPTSPVWRMWC